MRELVGAGEGARALADWPMDWMTAVCAIEAEVEELPGGVEPVAGLGVIDLALHDVDEEPDYEPAVVGLLADDVGEAIWRFSSVCCSVCEHVFYNYRVQAVGCQRVVDGEGGGGVRSLRVAQDAEYRSTRAVRRLRDSRGPAPLGSASSHGTWMGVVACTSTQGFLGLKPFGVATE